MRKSAFITILIFFILVLVTLFFVSQSSTIILPEAQVMSGVPRINTQNDNVKNIKIAGKEIKIDLAVTKEQQSQGLSGRATLKEDEGMLFVFDNPGKHGFWMKDMNFPIDIIWLNNELKVIYVKSNATPESFPEVFQPEPENEDAHYVLEVVSGFAEKNNIKIGDSVFFTD